MSEIFVDTIRKTGGSLGTDIRIKNTSVYESDGGTSVTQNLVQGLAKIHCNLNGTGTIAFRDSFNLGTTTDNGTGDYTFNFTNNMTNANYNCAPSSASGYSDVSAINRNAKVESEVTAPSSSLVRVQYGINYYSASALEDCPQLYMLIHGELA